MWHRVGQLEAQLLAAVQLLAPNELVVDRRSKGLTGKLGRNVVVSAEFARLTSAKLEDLGPFELKGVPTPERAFAPS